MKATLKGEKIREILIRKCKSQNWLAQRLEVTSGYMAQMLNGDRNPSPEMRQKLLDYFKDEYSFDDLFLIEGN